MSKLKQSRARIIKVNLEDVCSQNLVANVLAKKQAKPSIPPKREEVEIYVAPNSGVIRRCHFELSEGGAHVHLKGKFGMVMVTPK